MAHPRVITPAAELLQDAGKFLHGKSEWINPLAADLGIKPSTLRDYLKGKSQLRGTHPVVTRARGLVLDSLAKQSQTWRDRFDKVADDDIPGEAR
jgi:hypothetical protein